MERVTCLVGKQAHQIRKFSFTVAITLKKKMHVPAFCRNIKTGLVTVWPSLVAQSLKRLPAVQETPKIELSLLTEVYTVHP